MQHARTRPGLGRPRAVAIQRPSTEAALTVLARADRERPADLLLRQMFRAARGLDDEARRWISQRVFAYYRWAGWCEAPDARGLLHAWELQEAYQSGSLSLSVPELRQRAVPAWVQDQVPCTQAWLESLQRLPRVWIRARIGKEQEVAAGLPPSRAPLPDHPQCLEYLGREDLYRTGLFRAGAFELQDVASQAVGWICAPQAGQTWWDACAGAGGKTLLLSDQMRNRGLIWATDRSLPRLRELKRRAARAGVHNYRTAPWVKPEEIPVRTQFDGVLVDAPCSGLGTWQRNPHARWTTTPDDVNRLAQLQYELLRQAAQRLRPGGRLIYSVCTLTDQETRKVADRFEQAAPGFQPEAMSLPFPAETGTVEGARFCGWPHITGGDGMFVAAWRRVGPSPD